MTRFAIRLVTHLAPAFFTCFLATATFAQSLVTVRPGPDTTAWWLRADINPLHTEVRGIPTAKIRTDWCKATEFKRELFPKELLAEGGVDTMAEAELAFSAEGSFDGSGTKQVALVGVYETCRGQKGRFFLILDAGTNKIRFLRARPSKDRFSVLAKPGRSGIVILYCLECDVADTVRWDRAQKRFVIR